MTEERADCDGQPLTWDAYLEDDAGLFRSKYPLVYGAKLKRPTYIHLYHVYACRYNGSWQ